jgi:osmoprotectant transport system ATP-binding protein
VSENTLQSSTNSLGISLEEVTKSYPGSDEPAVDAVTMDVPAGEVVILVGPSGCGKTTTMRMVNRLIEPTSGRITLGGEDVLSLNTNELRRRIGYVIQQIGLFPHMTIGSNVGVVPRMLGWDRKRVNDRVDELLELVGLPPAQYRKRYPRELSGGQQQRIGVIRALAADPPVMLMDEPFGATDPITRDKLQNEFLRLQTELRKTIIFVTHDFDEAIKMGDRIAVLREQSHIAQYDTPAEILANPADDYVSSFIGSGAAIKRLNLRRVSDADLEHPPTVGVGDSPSDLRGQLSGGASALLLDDGRPMRWISRDDLGGGGPLTANRGADIGEVLDPSATLRDALNTMLEAGQGSAVVTDGDGRLRGTVSLQMVVAAIQADPSEVEPPPVQAPEMPTEQARS